MTASAPEVRVAREMAEDWCSTHIGRATVDDVEALVLAAILRARVVPNDAECGRASVMQRDIDTYAIIPADAQIIGAVVAQGTVADPAGGSKVTDVLVLNLHLVLPVAAFRMSRVFAANGTAANPLEHTPPLLGVRLPVERARLSEDGLAWLRQVEHAAGVPQAEPVSRLRLPSSEPG